MANVIECNGLTVKYGRQAALDGVSLQIGSGKITALLGGNGAGKTTLIRVLTGFLKPTTGSVQVLGLDPAIQAVQLRQKIGYVSDSPALYEWMRVGEIGWFAASFYGDGFQDHYRESIASFGLDETKKIKQLSKGQRAKVALSLATAHDPELLILDEPTSGLDPLVRREFLESMVDRVANGQTVLLSSHQIDEVQRIADDLVIIHESRVRVADQLSDLRENVQTITVDVDDSSRVIPQIGGGAEVLVEARNGRQHRWVVRGFNEESRSMIEQSVGVSNFQIGSVGIEDLFVAYTSSATTGGHAITSPSPAATDLVESLE